MEANKPDQTALPETTISTTEPVGKSASPRQPNDHDESPDSQASAPREAMQQAAADLASGQVDTDLRDQPGKNPKNNPPATPPANSTHTTTLPDGRKK
jgi:hypothetical protein